MTDEGMRLSLPGRIFAGFVALLLTFASVSLYTAWEVGALSRRVGTIHHTLLPLPPLLADLQSDLRGLDVALEPRELSALRRSVHVARRVYPYLRRLELHFADIAAHLSAVDAHDATEVWARGLEPLERRQRQLAVQVDLFFDRVEALGGEERAGIANDLDEPLALEQRRLRRSIDALGRETARWAIELQVLGQHVLEGYALEERRAVWSTVVLTAVGLALGIALTAGAAIALRPLRTLREGVARIARGEYAVPIHVGELHPGDELGALATDINQMAAAIRARDDRLAEQQRDLLHQERMATVGRLAAQITHELRNPLSSIGLNSELLMELLSEPETEAISGVREARTLLGSITQEVERLREITESYLSFARLPRPEPVPLDLNAICSETLEFVGPELERAKVKSRLDADRAGRPAYADAHQLRAALSNLLRNAREALEPRGGHVLVRIRTLGDQAVLEVHDDGPGFSPEARAHLFEPFFSSKPQGTGLGLSYVRTIIEAQGGTIAVEDASGSGAIVRLTLPLAKETEGDLA